MTDISQKTTTPTTINLNGIRRSGLGYVANLIRSGGITSQSIRLRGGKEVAPVVGPGDLPGNLISIHIARFPLDHIASLRDLSPNDWLPICEQHERVTMDDTPLRRAMRYYYDGNKKQRSQSTRTLRIETITPGTIQELFGVTPDDESLSAEINKLHHRVVTWADLKREDIRLSMAVADMGRAYGYETPVIEDKRICGGCI